MHLPCCSLDVLQNPAASKTASNCAFWLPNSGKEGLSKNRRASLLAPESVSRAALAGSTQYDVDDMLLVDSASEALEQDDGASSGYSGGEDVPHSGLSGSERNDDGLSLNLGEREPGSGPGTYYYIKVQLQRLSPKKYFLSTKCMARKAVAAVLDQSAVQISCIFMGHLQGLI